jgi:hypothetical protein
MKWGESRSEQRAHLEFPFTEATRRRLRLDRSPRRDHGDARTVAHQDARKAVVVVGLTVAFLAGGTPAVEAKIPKRAAKFALARTETTEIPKAQSGACNTVQHVETGYNVFNNPMISLSQEVYYCWGKVKKKRIITTARFTTKVWTKPLTPWRYDGPASVTKWMTPDKFEAGRTIQGKFHFCVFWYCVEAHPWVTQRVFAIGLYYGDGSL